MLNKKTHFRIIEALRYLDLNFSYQKESIIFFLIATTVTIIVRGYRQRYIEEYNIKKFFFLMIFFLISIILITSTVRILIIIIGWEALGLTSLVLIIFYPNKNRKINSILTMFINRLGDVILILIAGISITMYSERITNIGWIRKENCYTILICSLTKRAQFPTSSWLPAAIAAPTPISAIVHSSTLVTAGIFIVLQWQNQIEITSTIKTIVWISLARFLIGRLIATQETDLKKTIAFSTISQIRIIIVILSISLTTIAITHIIFHAFLKTLLFCTAGWIFTKHLGVQKKEEITVNKYMKAFILFTIFGITGLLFSLSFYTKDIIIEEIITNSENTLWLTIILIASILTIKYRIKIINSIKNTQKIKGTDQKIIPIKFIIFLLTTILLIKIVTNLRLSIKNCPILIPTEVALVSIVLISIIMTKKLTAKKNLINSTLSLIEIKLFTYSKIPWLVANQRNLIIRDTLIIKSIKIKEIIYKKFLDPKEKKWIRTAICIMITVTIKYIF